MIINSKTSGNITGLFKSTTDLVDNSSKPNNHENDHEVDFINPYVTLPPYEETILFYDAKDLEYSNPNYYYSTKIDKETIIKKRRHGIKFELPRRLTIKPVRKEEGTLTNTWKWKSMPNLKKLLDQLDKSE